MTVVLAQNVQKQREVRRPEPTSRSKNGVANNERGSDVDARVEDHVDLLDSYIDVSDDSLILGCPLNLGEVGERLALLEPS